jgi:hypothetical protein
VTVQAGIDERILELVGKHRAELKHLIDQAVDRELAVLVEQRLANGNGFSTEPVDKPDPAAPAGARVCRSCGRERPRAKFENGRRQACTTCRSRAHTARVRERERSADSEPTAVDDSREPSATSQAVRAAGGMPIAWTRATSSAGSIVAGRAGALARTARTAELAGAIG